MLLHNWMFAVFLGVFCSLSLVSLGKSQDIQQTGLDKLVCMILLKLGFYLFSTPLSWRQT
jgi:hypothetical protein